MNKEKNILTLAMIGFLVFALLDGLPYGYFTLLKFVVFIGSAYIAWKTYEYKHDGFWIWAFGFIAILFNPLIPIYLTREIWQVLDVATAIFLGISILLLDLKSPDSQKQSKVNETLSKEHALTKFNFTNTPNLLIGGMTGSGKSHLIHNILAQTTNDTDLNNTDLKLILMDLKRVEFNNYHTRGNLISPIVNEVSAGMHKLTWVREQIKIREESLLKKGSWEKILVIIDEYSDLMYKFPEQAGRIISDIAKHGPAQRIHLIVATSRLQKEVITPDILESFSHRIALTTATQKDSETIIGASGAERLEEKGLGFLVTPDNLTPIQVRLS
jgi:hypothetical protein